MGSDEQSTTSQHDARRCAADVARFYQAPLTTLYVTRDVTHDVKADHSTAASTPRHLSTQNNHIIASDILARLR